MSRAFAEMTATMLLVLGMADAMGAAPSAPSPARANALASPADRFDQATMKMDAWLRRLVGRYFVFESPPTISGLLGRHFKDGKLPDGTVSTWFVDCTAVGTGPGVLCFQYAVKDEPGEEASFRFDALVQFGLDPNASKIRMLMIRGGDGMVGESSANLVGETVRWMGMSCKHSGTLRRCEHTLRIFAPADGKYLTWTYGSRMQWGGGLPLVTGGPIYLYRISPEDGIGPDGLPRTMTEPIQDLDRPADGRVFGPFPR